MEEQTPIPFKQYLPNLSNASYFWVVILVSLIIFSILGYFVGVRVSELPSTNQSQPPAAPISQQIQPTVPVTPGQFDDNDTDYSTIIGSFIAKTNSYDQFVIRVTGLQNGANTSIDTDYRNFDNPHTDIQYPYMFSRLNPFRSYAVSASACRTDPKTYALICAKNIKITKCTGAIQGETCLIKGNGIESQSSGEVDFLLPDTTK